MKTILRKAKRTLSLLLALLMIVPMTLSLALPASAVAVKHDVGDGYVYFDPATGAITDCDPSVTAATIPSEIDGVPVTSIGNSAFKSIWNLKSISLPDTITSIGDEAFFDCESLGSIEFPASVKTVGDRAFSYCDYMLTVDIPEGVVSLGEEVFHECRSLTSVSIPDSVTSIGDRAFWRATSLRSIDVGNGNKNYCDVDGVLFNKEKTVLISYPVAKSSSYEIPYGVSEIYDYAFSDANMLKSIIIPESVTNIGKHAFLWCSSFVSVNIPDSVDVIEDSAFSYCTSLVSVNLPDSMTSIGDGAFSDCWALKSVDLPGGITEISNGLFASCTYLDSVTLPDTIKIIGDSAFSSCMRLKEIRIPDGVESIGSGAFSNCEEFTCVDIPESVKYIGSSAFSKCYNLTSIVVPDGITALEIYTFSNCQALTSVTLPDTLKNVEFCAFDNCKKLESVFYYGSAEDWKTIDFKLGNEYLQEAEINYNVGLDMNIPADAVEYNGNFYKIFFGSYTWNEAKALCEADGGHLVTITSAEEQSFIDDLNSTVDSLWIGASRDGYFNWSWVTGEEWNYTNWEEGEPNNSGNVVPDENCGTVWPRRWNDLNYENLYEQNGYICEWEPETTIITGEFSYRSMITGNRESYPFTYNESWFEDGAISGGYNHSMAQMSLRMAMSGAETTSDYVTDLYDKLGFEYTSESINFPTPYFNYADGESTIGYAIAQKVIDVRGKSCTLIAVTVRGAEYADEWGDNFRIGNGGEHFGFSGAAQKLTNAVKEYVSGSVQTEDYKIWITGFSRGGAVANITAHNLNSWVEDQNDVYAYCFECPRTVRGDYPDYLASENNIVNIINDSDIVTKVAPKDWGFARYGVDYYLPTGTYCDNYSTFSTAQVYQYSNIISNTGTTEDSYTLAKDVSTGMKNQVSFTSEVVGSLASYFESQSDYFENYEETVCALIASAMGSGEIVLSDVIGSFLEVLPMYPVKHPIITSQLVSSGPRMLYAHYPELCLSWLDSLSGESDYVSPRFRKLVVACPVNVNVYNSLGELVASIVDGEAVSIDGSTIEYYYDEETDERIFVLPYDGEYSVEVIATDDGTMTYSVNDVDNSKDYRHTVEYIDLEITKGEIYEGEIDRVDMSDDSPLEYVLSNNGNEYTPDVDSVNGVLPPKEHVWGEWQVSAEADCVSDGEKIRTCVECGEIESENIPATGIHAYGDWQITIEPTALANGEKIRICKNCEIVESMEIDKLEMANPFTDVKDGQWYTEGILWCYHSGYMAGVSDTEFGRKQSVTRAMFATILAKIDGSDISGYSKMSFTDVKPGQWYSNAIEWAASNGYAAGLGEGIFGYKQDVSREQIALFFYTYSSKNGIDVSAKADLFAYTDLGRVHSWALDAVQWAVAKGLISGTSETTLSPRDSATRGEIALIVKNYVETVKE